MLREFLELLQTTAVEAAGPQKLAIESKRIAYFSIGGKRESIAIPPPPRTHQVQDVASFLRAASRYGPEADTSVGPSLWHNDTSLIAILNDVEDRYDTVTLKLVQSETFQWLTKIGSVTMDQRTMVRALRTTLNGCVPESLLPAIRKLEVSTAGKTSSDMTHGRERGTKEFASELAGTAAIPEEIQVICRVYDTFDINLAVSVRCALDIQLPQMEFRLIPLPNQLTTALAETQSYIHSLLCEDWSPELVFFGTP